MKMPDHITDHVPMREYQEPPDPCTSDDPNYPSFAATLTPAQIQRAKDVDALLAMTYKDISRDTLEWLLKQAWDDGHVCGRISV